MDWTQAIDAYCERTDASYWSEPINALTNLAFIIGAIVMWQRCRGLTSGYILAAMLFAIGVGSWLFHTHAKPWAAISDVIPIILFSMTYVFLANRDFWGMPVWMALVGAALFLPYSAIVGQAAGTIPFFRISAEYWPLPLLIFVYAFLLRRRHPATAHYLAIGAAILCVSLTARSIDEPLCEAIPHGTHWAWHILNAVMLSWMIETWRRHQITARRRPDALQ